MADKFWKGGDSGNESTYNTAANWGATAAVPTASDSAIFGPRNTMYAVNGYDASGTAHQGLKVLKGFDKDIGTLATHTYLQFGLAASKRVELNGTGTIFLDVGAATTPDFQIKGTKNVAASTGKYGAYILGSDISEVTVEGGSVAIAALPAETATVGTLRISGSTSRVFVGPGVTLTNLVINKGACTADCAISGTTTVDGGTLTLTGSGTIADLDISEDGKVIKKGRGTITVCNLENRNCEFDGSLSMETFTVTTLNHNAGVLVEPPSGIMTISTYNKASGPVRTTTEPISA